MKSKTIKIIAQKNSKIFEGYLEDFFIENNLDEEFYNRVINIISKGSTELFINDYKITFIDDVKTIKMLTLINKIIAAINLEESKIQDFKDKCIELLQTGDINSVYVTLVSINKSDLAREVYEYKKYINIKY